MGKLYSKDEVIKTQLTQEQYRFSEVLSLEAVTDYLAKTKDLFNGLQNLVLGQTSDSVMLDATSTRNETLTVVRRLKFSNIADEIVTKPEKFQGLYRNYLKDLIEVSEVSVSDTHQLLSNIKMGMASFINEFSEDGILSVYGVSYAKESAKKTSAGQKTISAYFPESKSTFKARVKDVLRNLAEVEGLYKDCAELESLISHSKVKEISKLASEVSDMVDILIEQNSKSGILLRNTEAKKDLTDMIQIGAESVRFVSYLYANSIYFYNALKSLSEKIIEAGNR